MSTSTGPNASTDERPIDDAGASSKWQRYAVRLLWLAAATPAVVQVGLVLYTIFCRLTYPYDLEWMEGGLLGHAQRMASREGIYVEPSVDFIPYLYTPLYPALIALFGTAFGISYTLGRAISVLSLLVVGAIMVAAIVRQAGGDRHAKLCGAALSLGLFAATYPWLEGWYDLVRADTLSLAMNLGGLLAVYTWARAPGRNGRRCVAIAAAILAFSFFCKQTGIFYVATGGALLLVFNWRRLPIYVGVAGIIGLGGTWAFNRASGGWFWTYIYEVHQVHDWNIDRFWASFEHILGHFPFMTGAVATGLVVVLVTFAFHRRLPKGAHALLIWTPIFAISCVVGAVGWGTQWAHFNAFMPALATGAIAAGASVPAVAGAASLWMGRRSRASALLGVAFAAALAAQLATTQWHPRDLIPTEADRRAGDMLISHLRSFEGDVFMPYHPWYPVLAGKPLYVHRMGLLDMTYGNRWKVAGLREAFADHAFDAVVLDNRPIGSEFAGLREAYRIDDLLGGDRAPKVYSGAEVEPATVWVPAERLEIPDGTRVLFDFESGRLGGWQHTGTAWGRRPVSGPLANQGAVRRYGGRYFLSSFHGGDKSVGTIQSPTFPLSGSTLTLRLSGGDNQDKLRAELWVDGVREKVATGNQSEGMDEVMWSVAPYEGKDGFLRLVDEDDGPWGHLNVDEIWLNQ